MDRLPAFPPVERFILRNEAADQIFQIQVQPPLNPPRAGGRCPVVYASDANSSFDVLRGLAWQLQYSGHDAAPFILVGIGYPSEMPLAGAILRGRDLTFAGYPKIVVTPRFDGTLAPADGAPRQGGAEEFLRFLHHMLAPRIERAYPASDRRIYFGHSAGAGFGLYSLFEAPDLFDGYILSSPGLAFHGETSAGACYEDYEFLLDRARVFLADAPLAAPKRLYLSAGSAEEDDPNLRPWRLTSQVQRLAALFEEAGRPDLEVFTEILPGETHGTVWAVAFIHAIKHLLGPRP